MQSPDRTELEKPIHFDSLQQEVFLNLWRSYDRLKILEDELFCQYDLTAQQYNALRLLKAHAPKSVPTLQLAAQLVSRAPDITRLLDRLYARGLIQRERREENRRTVFVGITSEGLNLLATLAQQVRECHLKQLGHLSPEELIELTALLRKARLPHEPSDSTWR